MYETSQRPVPAVGAPDPHPPAGEPAEQQRPGPGGITLSDLLARRDCLKGRLSVLRSFLDSASALVRRHSASEIKVKSTVNVRQLQKQVDGLSKDLRELEETIQEKNWTTELM